MWIENDLYKQIVTVMPIPCIDLLVNYNGTYLITKRTQEPLKGKWYFPGGRLYKMESIKDCAGRVAKKELGIDIKFRRALNIYSGYYEIGYFGQPTHTFTLVVEVTTKTDKIILDESHSEFMWVDSPLDKLHQYVRKSIEQARSLDE